MKSPTRTAKLGFRDRLIDTYIESYVEWREGCADLYCAYRRWTQSEPPDRDLAFSRTGLRSTAKKRPRSSMSSPPDSSLAGRATDSWRSSELDGRQAVVSAGACSAMTATRSATSRRTLSKRGSDPIEQPCPIAKA